MTLGYVYFELSSYDIALKHLRSISSDFYDYAEVLLAIGWSTFKLNQYDAALAALNKMVKDFPNHHNLEEAYFVTGHCYLKLGYYDHAIYEYDKIISASADVVDFQNELERTRQEIALKEKELEELNTELIVLEANLLKGTTLGSNGLQNRSGSGGEKAIRKSLRRKLTVEKQNLEKLKSALYILKKQIGKGELLQNWRAYAEYGKARALYLKSTSN